MSAINVGTVMDEIGARLATIAGLRVFDFPPKSAQPPFAFVNMPESIEFDLTYGRGHDRMELLVFVGVAEQVDRSARDEICAYASASGAKSIKTAVESGQSVGASVRVVRVEFGSIPLASGTYGGAIFALDVAA